MSPAAEPRHLRRALIIWAVLSVIGVIAAIILTPRLMPIAASDAAAFDTLSVVVFTAAAVPVALFVWVFLGYSLVVFRSRTRPQTDAPRILAPGLAQIGWVVATSALCLFLVVWGLVGVYEQAAAAPNTLIVEVTGRQWAWTFAYPQYKLKIAALELPVNRPVEFRVTSVDVLHGFAIQDLGVRVDANPGEQVTSPTVTPTRTGTYDVRCIELCGLYHSLMFTSVHVVPDADFTAWILQHGGHP
ncbi:MAG TPA: cytochrome c oxidase subunit II [Candidatus Limnocylindrales bacterium]|nr:cytochrome c oxidase subunit II [Candidatus Limnocylindrales bacterium]